MMIINLKDPRPHGSLSCQGCPLIYEVPAAYYEGMDLATCEKRESCPCGFQPALYVGCYYDKPRPLYQRREP